MTDTQVEYASVIRSSGKDLLDLLNNILDLAKVESGTVTVELTDVSVDELRTALLREFEHVAQGKGVDYSVDIARDAPGVVVTDPKRLRQIFTNLLANAFKFTEQGKVHVQLRSAENGWNRDLESLAQASSVVAFSVGDTGIGIDEEQQQRIFEAFAQGDGSTARLYGGTGLGLSISRELVGLLGGEITVASTPGQGSTFTVYLPAGRPATAPAALATGAASTPAGPGSLAPAVSVPEHGGQGPHLAPSNGRKYSALDGLKILVVDDDFRNVIALTALLERGHAFVTVVESGADAIAILERMPDIDIVLIDIAMPEMDGYATIRAIRAIDRFKSLPIIAVTGKATAGERQRCIDAGANDYTPKPVNTAELLAALRPWLPKTGIHAVPVSVLPDREHPDSVLPPDTPQGVDGDLASDRRRSNGREPSAVDGVKFLVVDDDLRNIFAMTALLERGNAKVTVAENGAEAIASLERMPDVDIVLMDIMMPVMDGYATIRAIRMMERFKSLPIIAVTGKATAGERQRCIDAGANDYLPKPVDSSDLLAALRPWLPTAAQSSA